MRIFGATVVTFRYRLGLSAAIQLLVGLFGPDGKEIRRPQRPIQMTSSLCTESRDCDIPITAVGGMSVLVEEYSAAGQRYTLGATNGCRIPVAAG